ncbi:kinase D-interacting substrate of 220 kDa-like [Octopus vulgaris]|uniref:Kinase D-interacting substrate of 220 kDa-like n=1 Tax=Octopus vulgaris TaxID=6645 RepID=A0AA36FBS0_OCTVU|nr:kinase D-interacting substrate of 220 kDa-like [Octopus vulgaris]
MAVTTFKGDMLREAIHKGDLNSVKHLLDIGNINLQERDVDGHTFLMLAAEKGDLRIVHELLDADMDVNDVDNDNWTVLMYAAKEGHQEIVIELLEKHAVVDHRDLCGWTALMWACYLGHHNIVKELLQKNASCNIKAEYNMTCLAWSSGRGYSEIVSDLLHHGAKVNATDKYGTTPLVWGARKGYLNIVEKLLDHGADVDISGMNSWTALLVATRGGYTEIVHKLIERDPHVNAVDKDGFTALAISAKEGYTEISQALLAKGAYVNIVDKASDTILIHAVKGGHVDIVKALLGKHADVDIAGSEGKTALYWGIDKGYNDIVKQLLAMDPDLEICNKDGDTPLLKAVRHRNEGCVYMLLEKGAKVSAVDKKGDTALHIALRARSKRITEMLLRNPKNSQLLYKGNKVGETPYSIDAYYHKGILTQIFGHRNLNANDAENLLGYEIYSSALADVLSEPSLSMPITVGLYAKWGSGKSFLINKLQKEMKSFTQQNQKINFHFTKTLIFFLFFLNFIIGFGLSLAFNWIVGISVGFGLLFLQAIVFAVIKYFTHRYSNQFTLRISYSFQRQMKSLKMLLYLLFWNPRKLSSNEVPHVRFLFSDCTRLTSVGGEKSLAAMIGTLCDEAERSYGVVVARLFRIVKTQSYKKGKGKFKTACCIPYFVIAMLVFVCFCISLYLIVKNGTKNTSINAATITLFSIVVLSFIMNIRTWGRALLSLTVSQKKRVIRAADQLDLLKMDGFMQKLKHEVDLMSKMVLCLDSFTGTQTRLVVIVDGLDSCEQGKVLSVLDTVKTLFSDDNSPFITILAVDPHIIIKGIEQNLRVSVLDSNVHGYDYLRNIVHLPFFLQSQGLRIQKRDSLLFSSFSTADYADSPGKLKHQEPAESKLKKLKQWRTASLQLSNTTTSTFDLSHTLVKNDYFSDINPRSMRRLLNIVAVTGRLLRAYGIEFSWYRLAAWINLVEQWPYHASWVILEFEDTENMDDSTTLISIYKKVANKIPTSRDIDPLLEIDKDVRKLEVFLANSNRNQPILNVGDLKKFLPCTINLDPYLRKLIRETKKNMDLQRSEYSYNSIYPVIPSGPSPAPSLIGPRGDGDLGLRGLYPTVLPSSASNRFMAPCNQPIPMPHPTMFTTSSGSYLISQPAAPHQIPRPHQLTIPPILPKSQKRISSYSVQDVCNLLSKIQGIKEENLITYSKLVETNNVSGLVLLCCDFDELKCVMCMRFGDWQLFRAMVQELRDQEVAQLLSPNYRSNAAETPSSSRNNHFSQMKSKPSDPHLSRNQDSDSILECPLEEQYEQETSSSLLSPIQPKRLNSIYAQMDMECGMLREVIEDFTETVMDDSKNEMDVSSEVSIHTQQDSKYPLAHCALDIDTELDDLKTDSLAVTSSFYLEDTDESLDQTDSAPLLQQASSDDIFASVTLIPASRSLGQLNTHTFGESGLKLPHSKEVPSDLVCNRPVVMKIAEYTDSTDPNAVPTMISMQDLQPQSTSDQSSFIQFVQDSKSRSVQNTNAKRRSGSGIIDIEDHEML